MRIEPGQPDLTLRIGRVADMASEGWWSGDSHVHFLSAPGAQLEQMGEDLRVVNVLQSQWGALFTNTEDFSGRPSIADGGGYVTYVGQENRPRCGVRLAGQSFEDRGSLCTPECA